MRAADLRVNVDGVLLRVSGARTVPTRGQQVKRLHQMEIAFGPFERTLRLPVSCEKDRVTAHLEDGFLEVTLPKKAARRVEVETESGPRDQEGSEVPSS